MVRIFDNVFLFRQFIPIYKLIKDFLVQVFRSFAEIEMKLIVRKKKK